MNFEIVNPADTRELLSTIKKLSKKNFRFAAGCTDLLLDLKRKPVDDLIVVNLASVIDNHFTGIKKMATGFQIGAAVTAHSIVMNEDIKKNFPVLHESALNLASTQIRQVATIGGNLCTASPSGDIACALMALNATCELLDANGKKRVIPMKNIFTGVRTTVMKKSELLYSVSIPANKKNAKIIHSRFIKIGTRKSMECSVVSLAHHIQTDNAGKIISVGLAIGASAPTILYTELACEFLIGKNLKRISVKDKTDFADKILSYASPISDIRATEWYRKEVLHNISKAVLEV